MVSDDMVPSEASGMDGSKMIASRELKPEHPAPSYEELQNTTAELCPVVHCPDCPHVMMYMVIGNDTYLSCQNYKCPLYRVQFEAATIKLKPVRAFYCHVCSGEISCRDLIVCDHCHKPVCSEHEDKEHTHADLRPAHVCVTCIENTKEKHER